MPYSVSYRGRIGLDVLGHSRVLFTITIVIRDHTDTASVLFLLYRSRDDSIENLFEDDEIVGDLPNEEGMHAFNIS